ncbi:MAG: hypothetical protein ACFFBE_12010 [Promethearchaeota archaeon]
MTNIGGDTWQYDAWTPVSTGIHQYTIYIEDINDNWNSVTDSIEVVDNAPPSYSDLDESADPLELGATEVIRINVYDLSGVNQVLIEIEGVNYSMTNIGGDTWQYDAWTPVSTGTYPYTIYIEDINNNWNSVTDSIEVVDNVPPSYSDLDESADPLELGATEIISISVYDSSGINQVLIEIEGVNYSMTNIGGDTWQYDAWTPVSTGTYPYTIYMEDIDGNWNSVTDSIEVVDNVPPLYSDLDESADPLELGATEVIRINVYDLSGVNQVLIEIEGVNYSMTNIGGDTWQYDAWTPVSTGTYPYSIYMEDMNSNWNSFIDSIEVIDNFPPEIMIYEPNPYDQFGITAPEINIEFIDNNLDSTWYQMIGIISTGNYSWTGIIDQNLWNLFDSGRVTIRFYANDSMGNLGTASITVNKDITAPDILIIEPTPYDLFGKKIPYVDIEVEDQNLDTIWYKLFNSTQSLIDYSWTGSIKQSIWDEFNSGILIIRFHANDTLGNTRFLDITIIKDITPPDLIFYKPNQYDMFGVNPPILDLLIYDDNLDDVWYQLSNELISTKNYTWYGIISEEVWGEIGNGTVKISFYANDTLSNLATKSLFIRKDIIAPSIFITYPSNYSLFGNSPPNIVINLDEPNLDYIWYQISNGTTTTGNYSWISTIEQIIWDEVGNGTISIFLYSNDTVGNFGSIVLTIRKDIIAPKIVIEKPEPYNIFGDAPPIINVEFYDPHLSNIWYQLRNGTLITIYHVWTGIIEQSIWDQFGNGSVVIIIYANDSLGNLGIGSLRIHKDIIAPKILIEYPFPYDIFGESAPDLSIFIDDKNLNTTWYQMKNESLITLNYTWTGTLEQNVWDEMGNGTVKIIFYANDLVGNLGYAEITILKDLSAPIISIIEPENFEIFGINSPEFRIYISGSDIHNSWYILSENKYFFTKSDGITIIRINQTKWDEFGNGTVIIEFYVNDSVGNIGLDIIKLRKDIFAPKVKVNIPLYESYYNYPPTLSISFFDPNYDALWYRIGNRNIALINHTEQTIDPLIWNNLEQGQFQIYIFANDTAGNINNTYSYTLYKDTIAPLINVKLPINNSYSNIPPTLNITCFDPNFDTLWYRIGNSNVLLSNNTIQTLDWEIWDNLTDGLYQLFVYANDTFGHLNDLFILNLYKDTSAPEITIYSPNNSTFHNQPPIIHIYAVDPNLHTLWYEIGDFTGVLQNHIGQELDQSIWKNLPQGRFQLFIYANDSFGDLNNTLSLILYKDTLAPRVLINLPNNQTYWDSRPSINVTVYDPNLDKIWYKIGTEYVWLENNTETLISDDIWSNLQEGKFVVEIYANDYFGQINNTYKLILYKDTLAPEITIYYPYSPYFGGINAPNYELSITEANLDKVWYILVGYSEIFTLSDFSGTIDQTAWNDFGNGTVIIRFYANDTLGKIGIKELNFRKDVYTPIVKINLPINKTVWDFSPIISVSVSDPNLDSIWFKIGTIFSNLNNHIEQQINYIIWENLPQGEFQLYIYANDSAGNTNDSYYLILYKDTLAPNIFIKLPVNYQEIGETAPYFDIIITDDNLDSYWYTLDNGLTNITISTNIEQIDQEIWDKAWNSCSNGDLITIRFYANDTLTHIGFEEVIIIVKKPITRFELNRLTSLIFTGTLGVVLGITTITINTNKKFKRMEKEQQRKVNIIFYLALTLISLLLLSFFI